MPKPSINDLWPGESYLHSTIISACLDMNGTHRFMPVLREGLLDYVEMVCKQISKRFVNPPDWWTAPTEEASPPSLRKPDLICFEDKKTGDSRYCVRCQEEVDEEERLKEEEREKEKAEAEDKRSVKESARARMKRKAAEDKKKKAEKGKDDEQKAKKRRIKISVKT